MNRQLCAIFASAIALTTAFPAIAQTHPTPVQQLFEELGDRCNRATEVSFRSATLTSPDGATRAYAAGLLRKLVNGREANRPRRDSYCFSSSRETLNRQIMIERPDGNRQITNDDYPTGYVVFQPRSFSADSRYLVGDVQVAYTGGDSGGYVVFLDLANGELDPQLDVCKSSSSTNYIERYVGFSAPSEVVVACDALADIGYLEAIDLQTGSVRRLSHQPADLVDYGTVTDEFTVTRTQIFR